MGVRWAKIRAKPFQTAFGTGLHNPNVIERALSQKDGQNHKNMGVRQAFLHKCPSGRANLPLDGRLIYTATVNDRKHGQFVNLFRPKKSHLEL